MSWIQENKFMAGLAGVTAVISGAIIYYGSSQGSEYEQNLNEYDSLRASYIKLQKSVPFPSQGNLKAKKENISNYEAVIKDVRNTFAGFQAGKMDKITPEEFSNMRVKMEEDLRKAFGADTELPKETGFGFEKYKTNAAKSEATAMLKYELDAVQSLLADLAEAKPSRVNSILRSQLDVETGRTAAPVQPTKKGKKAQPVKKAYTLMPMELSFTAPESGVREFLREMVNSKQYFYAIRAMRIRNEKQVSPNEKDAGFSTGGAGTVPDGGAEDPDPFEGIVLPGDEPEAGAGEGGAGEGGKAVPVAPNPAVKPAEKEGERILKRVLGAEQLHVFIRFDIVFIENETEDADSGKTQP